MSVFIVSSDAMKGALASQQDQQDTLQALQKEIGKVQPCGSCRLVKNRL